MKKSRRLLSFLLSAVMLLSMFFVTSFAEEDTTDGVADITIKTSSDTAVAGDIITVTLRVATDYNATTMRWPVLFSNDFFELVENSETATEALLGIGGSAKTMETSNNVEFTSEYTSNDYGSVVFQWIGVSAETGVVPFNNPEGLDCFTFRLKVKEDVVRGSSGNIVIGNSNLFYKQMIKAGVDTPSMSDIVQGNIEFNIENAVVSFPVPQLIPVEGTSTVIDNENKLIRGLDLNVTDSLDNYVRALGCYYTVMPFQGNRMGTGTTVDLICDGVVYDTYTIIIAGDVNGDALVDTTDYIWLDLVETDDIVLNATALLAAEITGDGEFSSSDKVALDSHLIFAGNIDQATGVYSDY